MQLRSWCRGICLEPAELAGIAAKAQQSAWVQVSKQRDEIRVFWGEECGFDKLCEFIAQSDVVIGNPSSCRSGMNQNGSGRWLSPREARKPCSCSSGRRDPGENDASP